MKKYLLRYVIYFALFYVLSRAYIGVAECKAFGYGALFACLLCKPSYVCLSAYVPAYIVANLNLSSLIVGIVVLAVAIILIELRKKRNISGWIYYMSAFVSQLPLVLTHIWAPRVALTWLLALGLGLLFMLVCVCALRAIALPNFQRAATADQNIAFSLFVVVFALGLNGCAIYVSPLTIVAILCIYISTYCLESNYNFALAVCFGVGAAINSFNSQPIALMCLISLIACAFKSNIRLLTALAVVVLNIAFVFYFGGDTINWWHLCDVGVASIIFVLVPKSALVAIKNKYGKQAENISGKSIINRAKATVCKRLGLVSDVFGQMGETYKNLIKGSLPQSQAKEIIGSELVSKVCAHCPERNKCMRVDGKMSKEIFDEMLDAGLARGKVTLLDIPAYLTGKCANLNVLLNTLNALVKNYFNYANMIKNTDESKLLISDNLTAVSALLSSLSSEINQNVSFDSTLERRITEDLAYKGVMAKEATVYVTDGRVTQVTLVTPSGASDIKAIETCVSSTCGLPLECTDNATKEGYLVLELRQKPNYDIVFGVSTVSKEGDIKNGDSHGVIKVAPGKYILALADGMGTGARAHSTSTHALSLIENFYRAGFDSDMILGTVNKLLSMENGENYTTLDLCALNLYDNTLDFIKLGAPFAIIKRQSQIEVIEGSGLPIGVLDEFKPHITKKLIYAFDSIILFSDGIVDAFKDSDELTSFVQTCNTSNPQTLADMILDRAVDLCHGSLQDDMTVLVSRIYPV